MAKIMIIEESKSLRDMYIDKLSEDGNLVFSADNEDDAIKILRELNPDIVVLNVRINLLEKLRILEQIKTFDGNIPVIINSAYSVYRDFFIQWFTDTYTVKTSNVAELKAAIGKFV